MVCLTYTPLSLSTAPEGNQLYRFPVLVTRSCCVDIYRAWPHKALVSVAEKLLEEGEDVLSLVPLKRRERHSQSAAVCSIMAHVHLSSRSLVEKIYGVRALKFYSPDTYLDFVDLFRNICKRLCVKEKVRVFLLFCRFTDHMYQHKALGLASNLKLARSLICLCLHRNRSNEVKLQLIPYRKKRPTLRKRSKE